MEKNRITHSLSVANKMREIALEIDPENTEYSQDMFILGVVHDIGYKFSDDKLKHAEVGGLILKNNNYKYWKEVYYHGKSDQKYNSQELRILNTADLSVDHTGKYVSVIERLNDIKNRHGEFSFQYLNSCKLAEELNLVNPINKK